ncbi:MAG: glucan biosynthesis protein [Deltaproteobacteria bacterium]|jgi:glucans biosynthesis protein|nr:glucan biosynthesis protein [Deltaproteobacteria bacterium]
MRDPKSSKEKLLQKFNYVVITAFFLSLILFCAIETVFICGEVDGNQYSSKNEDMTNDISGIGYTVLKVITKKLISDYGITVSNLGIEAGVDLDSDKVDSNKPQPDGKHDANETIQQSSDYVKSDTESSDSINVETTPSESENENLIGEVESVTKPVSVFTFKNVENLARLKSRQAFVEQNNSSSSYLKTISENLWRQIRYQPKEQLFLNFDPSFQLELEHQGFIYDQNVALKLVEDGHVREINFDTSDFIYPEGIEKSQLDSKSLGYAGFSILFPRNNAQIPEKTVEFLGANHFKAAARHADLGVTSRAVIINPAESEGEEFAYFREFWIVKPEKMSSEIVVFALLESPSITGAYQFLIKTGSSLVMEVDCTIFLRENMEWPKKLGLIPMSGMYLYSEKENGSPYDWRPELHGVDAFLYADIYNNIYHRPLNNPRRLMVSNFELDSPFGFGLAQKDNNFDHYQDIGNRYDRRTWTWVELLDDFPDGNLELIEIPSSKEIHDNIIAFWSIKEEYLLNRKDFKAHYRLYWLPPASTPHGLGKIVSNRMFTDTSQDFVEFYLDFEGNVINNITPVEGLASVVHTGDETPILEKSLQKNSVTGGWRLRLKLKSPEEAGIVENLLGNQTIVDSSKRIILYLVRGENLPQPISEHFVYDFPSK